MTRRHLVTIGLILCLLPLAGNAPVRPVAPAPRAATTAARQPPALPPGVSQDWFTQATKNIQQSEYHFSAQADGHLSAPNRAQNLRMSATAEGMQLTARTDATAWQMTLRLTAWGRPDALTPIAPVTPTATENRLEYRYPGVTAWYVNRAEGLEQGFTVPAPPTLVRRFAEPRARELSTKPSDGFSLLLELAYSAALTATRSADGHTLTFTDAHGARVLDYGALHVTDATGRTLPAQLALREAHRFEIRVDDRGAQYPVTIDPVMTTPAWTAEGNQAGAYFGFSVATAGDVNGDGFSDVLISAPTYDSGEVDEGKVFLYMGFVTGLGNTPAWTAERNQDNERLGNVVAPAGDVNGDGFADVLISSHGASFDQYRGVFLWLGGDLVGVCAPSTAPSGLGSCGNADELSANYNADWRAKIREMASSSTLAGPAIATAGDVNGDGASDILIGESAYQAGSDFGGVVYLWLGGQPGACAPSTTPSGLGDCGYTDFTSTGNNAAWRAERHPVDPVVSVYGFGSSVSTAGDVNGDGLSDIVVGAYNPSLPGSAESAESAFVWVGGKAGVCAPSTIPSGLGPCGDADVGNVTYNADWRAESNQPGAQFGKVATAGDVNGDGYSDLLIGAANYPNPGSNADGSAFLWLGGPAAPGDPSGLGPDGTPANADWMAQGQGTGMWLGDHVAPAGDVNGDGFSDILITGRYPRGFPTTSPNGALLWLGGPSAPGNPSGLGPNGTPANADWNGGGSEFELTAATAGDVNGDGLSDIIIGSRNSDNPEINEGMAFLYYGAAAGLAQTPAWTGEPNQAEANLGWAVSTAGDVNGDGYSDVLVGAHRYDNGELDEGAVFCYTGGAAGLSAQPFWMAESNDALANFGRAVSTAGDVNGDGFSDVLVGAPLYSNGETWEGAAFLWLGSATGLGPTGNPQNAAWHAESNQTSNANDRYTVDFGVAVADAGDVNGDGYSDLLIGAAGYDNGQTDEGAAFLWKGGPSGPGNPSGLGANGIPSNATWRAESNQAYATLGIAVSAGDVNGDGYSDVLIGASHYTSGQPEEGAAFVWLGSAAGLGTNGNPQNAAWQAESSQAKALFGRSVATAGDVNGDGYSDLLIGAPTYDNGQTDEGAAFLWLGSATGLGPTGNPQNAAWHAESNQPIANLGSSVASAGDVNNDGLSDILIGAPNYTQGQPQEGAAFLWFGTPILPNPSLPGTPANAAWQFVSGQAAAHLGNGIEGLASAGDVNGDGFSDVILGAPSYSNVESREGRVFLFYGNGGDGFFPHNGDGLDRIPQQWRVNNIAPVSLLGKSDSPTSLRLHALGRTPLGRGRVKLQWEIKPLNQPLNFTNLQQATGWTDTGTPNPNPQIGSAVSLNELLTGLTTRTPYHWRLRIKSTSPFFPWSPWLTIQGNNRTEEKVRTP